MIWSHWFQRCSLIYICWWPGTFSFGWHFPFPVIMIVIVIYHLHFPAWHLTITLYIYDSWEIKEISSERAMWIGLALWENSQISKGEGTSRIYWQVADHSSGFGPAHADISKRFIHSSQPGIYSGLRTEILRQDGLVCSYSLTTPYTFKEAQESVLWDFCLL